MKSIFRFIFTIILTISLIIFFVINIVSSTIMDKNFILKKIDETGYYDKVYGYATSKFENYIIQSGLDKSVLDGILTREDVVQDTERILNNIYNSVEDEITAENLKTKLHANIDSATQGMLLTTEQKKSLDDFVNEISKDYLTSIAHFDFEKTIFNEYHKLSFVIEVANKVVLIFMAVSIFGLIVSCGRRFYKLFNFVGITLFSNGLFFIILNIFVNSKINVQTLTILNDAFSFTLREVVGEMLNQVLSNGLITFFIGLILIVLPNLIHNYFKYKGIDEEVEKVYNSKHLKFVNDESKNNEKISEKT